MKTLTEIPVADLKKVIEARETIKAVERRLFPFMDKDDGDHDGNGNGQNHRKMSQAVRNRISIGMKKRWAQRRKSSKKSGAETPA